MRQKRKSSKSKGEGRSKKERDKRARKTQKARSLPPLNKSVIFVDNNYAFWDDDMVRLSSAVDYIHIPSNMANTKSDKEWRYAKNLAKQGNLYAIEVAKHKFRNYPLNHGIDIPTAERILKWSAVAATAAAQTAGPQPVALFDWDRTISCVEGIIPAAFNGHLGQFMNPMMGFEVGWTTYPSKEFLDDMFAYLMRASRIPILKSLFRGLRARGVAVHILTNNPDASQQSLFRRIFLEMLSRLFNDDEHQQKEYEYERNGATVHIYEEFSAMRQTVSSEELDAMLHSTIDYIREGEPLNKSLAVCRMNPPIEQLRGICGNPEPSHNPNGAIPIVYIL